MAYHNVATRLIDSNKFNLTHCKAITLLLTQGLVSVQLLRTRFSQTKRWQNPTKENALENLRIEVLKTVDIKIAIFSDVPTFRNDRLPVFV